MTTGEVLTSWGEDMFFMPHMITVDQGGNVWLTDVGLHQVFKYSAEGKLLLTLGKKLEPGTGSSFCKPTQVFLFHGRKLEQCLPDSLSQKCRPLSDQGLLLTFLSCIQTWGEISIC